MKIRKLFCGFIVFNAIKAPSDIEPTEEEIRQIGMSILQEQLQLASQVTYLQNLSENLQKDKDSLCFIMEGRINDLRVEKDAIIFEKNERINDLRQEKDARILELTNQVSYLKQHQSSGLDKNSTIGLKIVGGVCLGCLVWQFFIRDFVFYYFPKLDKGKIERMKREEARLAALRARA